MSSTEAEHEPRTEGEPEPTGGAPQPAGPAGSAVEEGAPDADASTESEGVERDGQVEQGDGVEQAGAEQAGRGELDRGAIEAILLVTDEPLQVASLAQVLEQPVAVVEAALSELAAEYTKHGRGFELREVAGGWRLYTREEYAAVVEKFVLDGQQAKLTQAALETLAVVAYRQPVSRARVSAIRGVNCDGVMKTLVSRGLVTEAGADRDSGATLFVTTAYFLERLGLGSLEELPDLAPYLPDIDEMEELAEGMGGNRTASSQAEAPAQASASDGAEEPDEAEPSDRSEEPEVPEPSDRAEGAEQVGRLTSSEAFDEAPDDPPDEGMDQGADERPEERP